MPTRKELENAWKLHDSVDDIERECEKMAPKIKGPDGTETSTWNDKLNHSHFNKACQAWVDKYAREHPVPRQIIEETEWEVIPKRACSFCHKQVREDRLYEEPTSGQLVCSTKCEKRVGMKVENVVAEKKEIEERKVLLDELAKTGEIPKPEITPMSPVAPVVPPGMSPVAPVVMLPVAPVVVAPTIPPITQPAIPIATPVISDTAPAPCETHEWEPRTNQEGTLHLRQCKKCGIVDDTSISTSDGPDALAK